MAAIRGFRTTIGLRSMIYSSLIPCGAGLAEMGLSTTTQPMAVSTGVQSLRPAALPWAQSGLPISSEGGLLTLRDKYFVLPTADAAGHCRRPSTAQISK